MDSESNQPRIIIAEDHILIQEATRAVLAPTCEVVATVEDGLSAIEAASKHKPDIILVDISLPLASGFVVAEKLRDSEPEVKVVFVTAHSEKAYVERAFELGARAFVLKGFVRTDLPLAIKAVMRGSVYRSQAGAE